MTTAYSSLIVLARDINREKEYILFQVRDPNNPDFDANYAYASLGYGPERGLILGGSNGNTRQCFKPFTYYDTIQVPELCVVMDNMYNTIIELPIW